MAAGLGFKDFTTGEVLTAADVDGYLMQGVWVFASAAARDAAVTSPQEGNFAYLKDTNVTTYYTGSTWANLDTTGMTNPMTTTGDTIYSSSGSTPARLGIGTAGQVLTVNSGATAPEWKTPAAGSTYVGAAPYGDNVFQAISDLTNTAITFPSEEWDTDGFHSTSSNTSRITIPTGKGGKYQITAFANLSATSNVQQLKIYKNGSPITGNGQENGVFAATFASSDRVGGTTTVTAVATDYFEIFIIISSGGASRDVRYARVTADYLGA
jgi:hypothetical protein